MSYQSMIQQKMCMRFLHEFFHLLLHVFSSLFLLRLTGRFATNYKQQKHRRKHVPKLEQKNNCKNHAKNCATRKCHNACAYILQSQKLRQESFIISVIPEQFTAKAKQPLIPTWLYKMVATMEAAIFNCQCDQMQNCKDGCEVIYFTILKGVNVL